jgi:hypothetical protein
MFVLALDTSEKYVAAAYVVFIALIFIYVAILAIRVARTDREVTALAELAEKGSE